MARNSTSRTSRTGLWLGLVLCLAAPWQSRAEHIIGGTITYECLGLNGTADSVTYRFFMRIYRDCREGQTGFDSQPNAATSATVSFFNGQDLVSDNGFGLGLAAPTVTSIDLNFNNPCVEIPQDICVEEGLYIFTETLPLTADTLSIVYQRCCRNNTISNILDPGGTGATYVGQITPFAQVECNSSPVFNQFPPVVICSNRDFVFDHSATDPDGDSLVYFLCDPLVGGGSNSQNANGLNGIHPDPDGPPPYASVEFIQPTFSAQQPMGPMANVAIDPSTGRLTATPSFQGQFVMSVCVEEYRNGVLLSTVRREIQFNVVTCREGVVADIASDEVGPNGELVINSCGDPEVQVANQSGQEAFLEGFRWELDLGGGNTAVETTRNLDFTFPGVGQYPGLLIVNPATAVDECKDTAVLLFNIFPEVAADIDLSLDSCSLDPVQFSSTVTAPAGGLTYAWSFGDGQGAATANASHTYGQAGNFSIAFTATDANGCSDSQTASLAYFPIPDDPLSGLSGVAGCSPVAVTFPPLAGPINDAYTILWDFGDGNAASGQAPAHAYNSAGLFDVSVDVVSPTGCTWDSLLTDFADIGLTPTADFSFSPSRPDYFDPVVKFTDQSLNAEVWDWRFGQVGASTLPNPSFIFPDTGQYAIQLIVSHSSGCSDTTVQTLDVIPRVTYFMPNAFTPNEDGLNDTFQGVGRMDLARNFSFSVWNRWGEQVFYTEDPSLGWNGRRNNEGPLLQSGVYVYLVRYEVPRQGPVRQKGQFMMIR